MEKAPFSITPLVKEVLAALVESSEPLSAPEVAQQCGPYRSDHVSNALGRMRTTGWVAYGKTPRPTGPAVMGYTLKAEYRPQAEAIVKHGTRAA